jgi:hypothetical protein
MPLVEPFCLDEDAGFRFAVARPAASARGGAQHPFGLVTKFEHGMTQRLRQLALPLAHAYQQNEAAPDREFKLDGADDGIIQSCAFGSSL